MSASTSSHDSGRAAADLRELRQRRAAGEQYRQGDILLISEPRLPRDVGGAVELKDPAQGMILADEAAAPTHVLQPAGDVWIFRSNGCDGLTEWLEVRNAPVLLTHPQHAPLSLPPGIWRVVRQRQYDPATGWEASHPTRGD
jgi:hypothetical protein